MSRKKKEIPEIPVEGQAVEEVQAPLHVKALERCLPHAEKLRLMVREVLREECGRELANGARAKNQEFDWNGFNSEFRQDYNTASLKELMGYCSRLYGLNTLDQIRERRSSHKKARSKKFNNNTNKPSKTEDNDDEFIDDIETEDFDNIPE